MEEVKMQRPKMKPTGNARLIRNYEKGKSTSKTLAGRADSRKLVRLAASNKDRARIKTGQRPSHGGVLNSKQSKPRTNQKRDKAKLAWAKQSLKKLK